MNPDDVCLECVAADDVLERLLDDREPVTIHQEGEPVAVLVPYDEYQRLLAKLEDVQLRRIEAENPGIDMDEVRRVRAGGTGRG